MLFYWTTQKHFSTNLRIDDWFSTNKISDTFTIEEIVRTAKEVPKTVEQKN